MAPRYLAGRPSLGPANSVIFILSVFLFSPLQPPGAPPRAAPGSPLMDGAGTEEAAAGEGIWAQPDPRWPDLAVTATQPFPGAKAGRDPSRKDVGKEGRSVEENRGHCSAKLGWGQRF